MVIVGDARPLTNAGAFSAKRVPCAANTSPIQWGAPQSSSIANHKALPP